MATTRRFQPNDLLRFNAVNVDKLTETQLVFSYHQGTARGRGVLLLCLWSNPSGASLPPRAARAYSFPSPPHDTLPHPHLAPPPPPPPGRWAVVVAAVLVTATAAAAVVATRTRLWYAQYNVGFYYTYLTQHPDIQVVVSSPADQVIAYSHALTLLSRPLLSWRRPLLPPHRPYPPSFPPPPPPPPCWPKGRAPPPTTTATYRQ
ncbi:hypothetical protein I4F81_010867 [Pyropia yezoensis]|uniref:Uncharacterized protein n=1 Tax=Pyropia yezoensis TaxID=2788 RepID=A0ACC3CEU8_PYRYE|nr:hypothetical protein I4F81_010867 [Neopyropia yezoensis]